MDLAPPAVSDSEVWGEGHDCTPFIVANLLLVAAGAVVSAMTAVWELSGHTKAVKGLAGFLFLLLAAFLTHGLGGRLQHYSHRCGRLTPPRVRALTWRPACRACVAPHLTCHMWGAWRDDRPLTRSLMIDR